MTQAEFQSQVVNQVRMIVIWQWVGLGAFILFLVAMGLIALKAVRDLQAVRSRRIQPLIDEGKALAMNGTRMAKSTMEHGKRIYDVLMVTAESVGMKARTTGRIVQGTVPQLKRLPVEVAATTGDVKLAMRTAKQVEAAMRTARTAGRMARLVSSGRQVLTSFRRVASSREAPSRELAGSEPNTPVATAEREPPPREPVGVGR